MTAEERWRELAAVWREVLRIDGIDVAASFAEHGGSSLAASRMVLMARRRLGLELRVSDVLAGAGIKDLVATAASAMHASGSTGEGQPIEFPVTPPQLWLLMRARRSFVNGMGIVDAVLDRSRVEKAAFLVAQAHDAIRVRFRDSPDSPDGFVARTDDDAGPKIDWSLHDDLASATESMQAAYGEFIGGAVSDLIRLRGCATPRKTVLGLFADHRLLDGESIPLFFAELARAYRGDRPLNPDGPRAADLASRYQGPIAEATLTYWDKIFEAVGPYPSVMLPDVRPRPDAADATVARVAEKTLGRALVEGFRATCKRAALTEFGGFLACLVVALDRAGMTGNRVGVNTASSGRFWSDTAESIGNFAHEITLDLGARTSSLPEALRQARSGLAAAMRHDNAHRGDLLRQLARRTDQKARPPGCLWINAERAWDIGEVAFESSGDLSFLAPMELGGPRTRPYPGLSLSASTAPTGQLLCEYSHLDWDDAAARALLTHWADAVADAAAISPEELAA